MNYSSKNGLEDRHKKLFESIIKRVKKNYFLSIILKHKNNIKKTQSLTKEALEKTICTNQNVYPKKDFLDKETFTNSKLIPLKFNRAFIETEPKLAKKTETPAKKLPAKRLPQKSRHYAN